MAYLAELDTNGIPVPGSAFNATVRLDGPVRALLRSPDGRRLYVGGEFNQVNGENRAASSPSTRPPAQIDDRSTRRARATTSAPSPCTGPALYIAGAFTMARRRHAQLAAGRPRRRHRQPRRRLRPAAPLPGPVRGPHRQARRRPAATDPDHGRPPAGSIEVASTRHPRRQAPDGRRQLPALRLRPPDPTDRREPPAQRPHRHRPGDRWLCGQRGPCTWQPEQGSNELPAGLRDGRLPGRPQDHRDQRLELFFTASGGAGGRVIAWTPGRQDDPAVAGQHGRRRHGRGRPPRTGSTSSATSTTRCPTPNDPCLDDPDPATGGSRASAARTARRTATSPPSTPGRDRQRQEHRQGPHRPDVHRPGRHQRGPVRRAPSAPTGCTSAATSPTSPASRWAAAAGAARSTPARLRRLPAAAVDLQLVPRRARLRITPEAGPSSRRGLGRRLLLPASPKPATMGPRWGSGEVWG